MADMVLKDVTEYEVTPEGITETGLGQTLLNGNNIAMVRAGVSLTARRELGVN